jgi:hypothetical protein
MMDDSKEHTEADSPPDVALSNAIIALLTAASKVLKIESFRDYSEAILGLVKNCERWAPKVLTPPEGQLFELLEVGFQAMRMLEIQPLTEKWLGELNHILTVNGVVGPRLGKRCFLSWHRAADHVVGHTVLLFSCAIDTTFLKCYGQLADEAEPISDDDQSRVQKCRDLIAEAKARFSQTHAEAISFDAPDVDWQEMYVGLQRELLLFEMSSN